MISQVPEMGDGGYWYVLPAMPSTDTPGWTVSGFPTWCAWYSEIEGTMMVAVRTPDPVTVIAPAGTATASDVLQGAGYTGKPFGRIGGR